MLTDKEPTFEPKTKKRESGIVTKCDWLNVRGEANQNSAVIEVIRSGDRVKIDTNNSTFDWYHVITASGTEGYAMKRFVETE